ncbi:hypothetical protein Btru_033020 [Bulinus truncatus]|nr:hypothetical protein Btru_033020 [Bulinus truncatus]
MRQMAANANVLMNNMIAQMNGEPEAEAKWTEPLPPIDGVLPGLQYLVGLDKVVVDEKKDYMNTMSILGQNNAYRVLDKKGEQLYMAKEDQSNTTYNSVFLRPGMAPVYRGFNVRLKDSQGLDVLNISRESQQCAYSDPSPCCSCISSCAASVQVFACGSQLGSVTQKWGLYPGFSIKDGDGKERAEAWTSGCCHYISFSLKSKEFGHCGEIKRTFKGGMNVLGVKETFEISFPKKMDPRTKALIISTAILLDYRYFSGHGRRR